MFLMHSQNGVPTMNTVATTILRRAYAALRADPGHDWAADLIEVGEMLRDREKELAALHQQLGKMVVMKRPTDQLPAG